MSLNLKIKNTIMKKYILSLIVSFLFVSQSFACSCIMPDTPTNELDRSYSVFIWKVNDIKLENIATSFWNIKENIVSFEVDSVLKWEKAKNIEVKTAEYSATCGYTFEKDKEYIVYAYDNEWSLWVSLCSRTSLLENASEDLEELDTQILYWKVDRNNNLLIKTKTDNIEIFYAVWLIILAVIFIVWITKLKRKKD